MRLILGSASPRRRELLAQIGLVPDDIRPPGIDETPRRGEVALIYCRRMAREKVEAMTCAEDEVVLCADTTVALGRRILGKPADREEARRMLSALSGRRHQVITAIAVRTTHGIRERSVVTQVKVKRLSELEMTGYLDTEDWEDKAGAYAIQGPAGTFIPWIQGSYTGVMGLPVAETAWLLASVGVAPLPAR